MHTTEDISNLLLLKIALLKIFQICYLLKIALLLLCLISYEDSTTCTEDISNFVSSEDRKIFLMCYLLKIALGPTEDMSNWLSSDEDSSILKIYLYSSIF